MKKIGIYYHTGAGSTKAIGEVLKGLLSDQYSADMIRVENNYDFTKVSSYDYLIFGYPVFGFNVSDSMREFAEKIPVMELEKNCFIYTTFGFASGNSIRKLANILYRKNIWCTGYLKIRSPASDASLMFPEDWKWTRRFEKKAPVKIVRAVTEIKKGIKSQKFKLKKPNYKFLWVGLEKFLLFFALPQEQSFIKSIRIIEDRCTNCGLCIAECRRGCWIKSLNIPEFHYEECDFCLGCIHHCPAKAITFLKKPIDNQRLNKKFFRSKKKELLDQIKH